jgi:hypothetical protein
MPDQSDDPRDPDQPDYGIVLWWAVALIIVGIALIARYWDRFL